MPVIQANTTLNSPNLTNVSPGTGTLYTGMPIMGPGIPAGTTILSITDSTDLVLSQNATITTISPVYLLAAGYTTRPNAKLELGIPALVTTSDSLIDFLIVNATAGIDAYLGYKLAAQTLITEYYSGNDYPDLFLKHFPVLSVASVYQDDNGYWGQGANAFAASTLLTAGIDYALIMERSGTTSFQGLLRKLSTSGTAQGGWPGVGFRGYLAPVSYRPGGAWCYGEGNILVNYSAGFTTIPSDIEQACINLTAFLKRSAPVGGAGFTSESLSKYSYSNGNLNLADSARCAVASSGEMGTTRQILSKYKDVMI